MTTITNDQVKTVLTVGSTCVEQVTFTQNDIQVTFKGGRLYRYYPDNVFKHEFFETLGNKESIGSLVSKRVKDQLILIK